MTAGPSLGLDISSCRPSRPRRSATGPVPITKPLLAILEMRKHGPDGKEHEPDDYVFGNSVGLASFAGAVIHPTRRPGNAILEKLRISRTAPLSSSALSVGSGSPS